MKNVNKKKLFMTIGISSSIVLAAVAPKAIDVFASDFNRTGSGSVNTSSSGVKPLVADDKVKAVPNGEKNFNATVALTTEAGLGSGILINEDTIVTVAHNFVHLNTKANPISVENNVNKSGDVHIATLPNGKQVRFSNDDVKFWNREGFVNGFKNDLAVIKLRNKFTGETPATVSNNVASLKAADTIHVFGFPKGKLQPILNGKVESVENYGANIMGVAYQGSAPGMSGGGLYNAQGELIGVHQNGVEGLRAGGISFSKEQLDWVNAIARGENAQPVYLKDDVRNDDKDKDKTTKVEFKKDRVRINDLYELDSKPYLIVKETSDMKIDEDPGLVAAMIAIKGNSQLEQEAREKINKLINAKTGVVFKVRSYESDGSESWRYFRTWTNDVNYGDGITRVPYNYYHQLEDSLGNSVSYDGDGTLDYGKAFGVGIAGEENFNVAYVLWTLEEPAHEGEDPFPSTPNFEQSIWDKATIYERYTGDDTVRSGFDGDATTSHRSMSKINGVRIGVKSVTTEEVVERRKVKYQANSNLDVNEKVVQEGSDKIKKTTTKYTLNKKSDERNIVEPLVQENEFDIPKDSKVLPTVENGGITATTSEEFTELKDKIIEKRVPKDTQKEEVLEPKVIYQKDDTREKGAKDIRVEGVAGKKVTPIKYDVNPDTGEVIQVPGEPVITPAKDTIIKVAAKTRTKYVANDEDIIKETTEYSVNPDTGEVTSKVTREISNAGGAKKVAEVTKTPSPKKYVKDDTREKGQPDIVEKGQDGELVYEFLMIVDENTGEVTKGKGVLVKDTKPTDTIVKVAAKDKVEMEEIQPSVVYERDDTRDFGTPNVEIKGELGKKATTTEYSVNEKTGEITEVVKDPVVTPAGITRIQVGTKKRVETIRKGGNVIERLTEYELDSKTGKVTEKITEKLLSSNGNVPAPVLDIPEYTGMLSGNGIDENGNQITPPVVDVPEFNGGVAPNDAPKVDIPEYKGEVKKPEEPQQTTTTQEVKKPEEPKQTTTTQKEVKPEKPQQKHDTQKEDAKPKLPKTGAESIVGLTVTGLLATIGAAFAKLRKKK
jgi:hypothetical protein